MAGNLATFHNNQHTGSKKGGQIISHLELKEINLGCSNSEYGTQLNDKGSVLNLC